MAYPGPGPSSYYTHQHQYQHQHQHQQTPPPGPPGPPPHHVYGTHSPGPGPRPNYYPYPHPPPLPQQQQHVGQQAALGMGGQGPGSYPTHTPPPLPLPTLPPNGRGRGNMNGGYNSRGGGGGTHHYYHHHQQHYTQQQHYAQQQQQGQHYPPPQQQQQPPQQQQQQPTYTNHPHAHMVPPPITIHPPQHLPYAPQSAVGAGAGLPSAKYGSYSPSMSTATTSYSPSSSSSSYMPSPSAPIFTPSWQTRQAMMGMAGSQGISPLPKQLSMPPPVVSVPEVAQNGSAVYGHGFYGAEPEPEPTPEDTHLAEVEAEVEAPVELPEAEPLSEQRSDFGPEETTSAEEPTTHTESALAAPTFTVATTLLSPSTSDDLALPPSSEEPALTSASATTPTTSTQQHMTSYAQMGTISTTVDSSSSSLSYSEFPSLSTSLSSPRSSSSVLPTSNSSLTSSSTTLSTATSSTTLPSSSSTTLPSIPANTPNPTTRWAIWSRRPQDPANAPSIIISPRARPPPDVVGLAMDLRTPVESRSASPVAVVGRKSGIPFGPGVGIGIGLEEKENTEEKEKVEEKKETETETETETENRTEHATQKEKIDNETSFVLEDDTPARTPTRTPNTTVPCSPASSQTSISVSVVSKSEEKKVVVVADAAQKSTEKEPVSGSITPTPAPASIAPVKAGTDDDQMLAEPIAPISLSTPTPTSDSTSSTAAPSSTAPQPSTATPSAAAAAAVPTPAPAPVKKSWASLLRPATPSSSSSGGQATSSGPTRNALPTSSVVGFSIPADSALSSAGAKDQAAGGPGISPSRKSELLKLLTTGPSPLVPPPSTGGVNFAAAAAAGAAGKAGTTSASASSVMRIKPRGLINSGNMCFANAVLQIMVYCPPFHRLFVELGRVLSSGAGVNGILGSSSSTNGASGVNGKEAAKQESATPLVDATIEFLREFIDEKDKAAAAGSGNGNGNARNGGSASGSGSGYSYARGGKGKEREEDRNDDDAYDWADGDAFLPSGIYDAMKAKKRFDSMRGGQQEDAEEFFGFYLDTLEEELLAMLHAVSPTRQSKDKAVVEEREEAAPADDAGWLEVGKRNRMVNTRTIKTTESPITRIFGGKFRTTLRTPGQKDSVIVEDWRSLRLDIQQQLRPGDKDGNGSANGNGVMTVQEALAGIAHPQQVQVQVGGGSGEGTHMMAQQQVLIEALPEVLVLHVKRFLYDVKVGGTVKVGKQIRFGPELEIGADIMVPAAKKSHPARYKLFGVLYHHGLSASGGHYTLDVLHPNRYPSAPSPKTREGWVRIDDNLVSDVRMDDVFGAWERDESRCAYLLFYRRI